MKRRSFLLGAGAATLLAGSGRACTQETYRVVSLGRTSAGGDTWGTGVNDSGQVAGYGTQPGSSYFDHALLWSWDAKGVYVQKDLGTFGGRQSWASNINNLGQCVGTAQTKGGYNRAFLWNGSKLVDISGRNYTQGHGINNIGQATFDLEGRPAVWKAGKWSYLSGMGYPYAINDNSIAVGSTSGTGADQAAIWRNGQRELLPVLYPERPHSAARSINKSDIATGHVQVPYVNSSGETSWVQCPVIWKGGGVNALPLLDGDIRGFGFGINDGEQVVGTSSNPSRQHAFIWDAANGTRDLNDLISATDRYDPDTGLGWVLQSARGISNNGYITGNGRLNGVRHGFLLIPPGG